MKQGIIDKLNSLILGEKGTEVTMDSLLLDSNMDSLGTMYTLVELDHYYPFFDSIPAGEDVFVHLDIPTLTVRELIKKCRLAISNDSNNRPNGQCTPD